MYVVFRDHVIQSLCVAWRELYPSSSDESEVEIDENCDGLPPTSLYAGAVTRDFVRCNF